MRSTNPILREEVLNSPYTLTDSPMTVSGTLNKLLFFALVAIAGAGISIYQFNLGHFDTLNMILMYAMIPILVLSLIIAFNIKTTPYLGTLFSFIQGAWIGAFSCFLEKQYEGIVSQAVVLTLMVVLVMGILYKFNIIRATEKFRAIIFVSTISIGLFYIISYVAMMFFHMNIPYFDSMSAMYSSPLAIGINILIVLTASLNLIIDFDFIEKGTANRLPIIYEWYGAFGLMVTILWMYIEILRLLSRTRSR